MNLKSSMGSLYPLARLYGVQTAYYDVFRNRKQASAEALLAVLKALGSPVSAFSDITSAWREQQLALWRRPLAPVVAAWEGRPPVTNLRLPASLADLPLRYCLVLENGERKDGELPAANLPVIKTAEVEGILYKVKQFVLPGQLPPGYHRLSFDISGKTEETLIISAPLEAYSPPEVAKNRRWGVFLPLYALHTGKSWGGGDFADFEAFMAWTAEKRAQVVATLPLLASFFDSASSYSPYNPVSRLMWNEFYVDIAGIPEMQNCPSAKALVESSAFQKEIESLRGSSLVNYRQQMTLKRRVLEELCRCLFSRPSERLEALRRFAEANPAVENYARFRAACEKRQTSWRSWPQSLQAGVLKEGDYDEETRRYHLYAQWLARQQVESIHERALERNLQLYFDLPMGVHLDGYDVWHERSLFVPELSAGAPPDAVFTGGQYWEFPPQHPERIREQGYRYTIAYLRHHMRYAGVLRIDHVMGLHRLFCIPRGMEAGEGVYIRYPAGELYAIITLESHRNKTIIVGEDLGTVPAYVRREMARHKLHRMYVVQYELASDYDVALRTVPQNVVASLNTHDMHPFAAFWQGRDIEERSALGLLDKAGARAERKTRRDTKKALVGFLRDSGWLKVQHVDAAAVFRACLAFLSGSRAGIVLVNLEDLWQETEPQNLPGTGEECPNWRRKARYRLEDFRNLAEVNDILCEIDSLRRKRGGHTSRRSQIRP